MAKEYGDGSIKTLDPVTHIRLRPGMYVGEPGTGAHRADRLVCDFLRMARFSGDLSRITVRTNDKDFIKEVKRLRAGA